MASLSFYEPRRQIYLGRFAVCLYVWDLLTRLSTVPNTLYSPCNSLAVCSWAKCKESIDFLMLSVLTLISIYSGSKVGVHQARLVEGKDPQNELFRHVCKLTYKVLKDSCDLLGERQEMLISAVLGTPWTKAAICCLWCCNCALFSGYCEQVHISLQLITKEQSSWHAWFLFVFQNCM